MYDCCNFQVSGTTCLNRTCNKFMKVMCPYCYDKFLDLTRHRCKRNIHKDVTNEITLNTALDNIRTDDNISDNVTLGTSNIFHQGATFQVL